MGAGDTFNFYNYVSDNGGTYQVKLSAQTASQGGFTKFTGSLQSGDFWGFGVKNLRHVWGTASGGQRTRLPIANASNAKFVSGGTFTTKAGLSMIIQGAIGEERKFNSVG